MFISGIVCHARDTLHAGRQLGRSASQLTTPRHRPLSSSAQRGHFVSALRRANRLAGAVSSPTSHHRKIFTGPDDLAIMRSQYIDPPKAVKGWPTPILTREDIDSYLIPLYARGWSVEYRLVEEGKYERINVVPVLRAMFTQMGSDIPTWEPLREFGSIVQQLEESENHHVEWKLQSSAPIHLSSKDFLNLNQSTDTPPIGFGICLHTHSAILPPTGVSSDSDKSKRRVPGLTIRDVRFAVILDNLIGKREAGDSEEKFKLVKDFTAIAFRPKNMDELLLGPKEDVHQ